jgi:RNA polymerase sigma-70 factor, ECF subfamily
MHTLAAVEGFQSLGQEQAESELDDIDGLVRTYRARLLRFVMFSVGDEDVAASIVQDTFLKAWIARKSFRGDCTVKSWLTSIALNLVRDHQRIRKFQFWRKAENTAVDVFEAASLLPSNESSPENQVLASERARQISRVLQELSFNQRTVFLMRFQEDLEISEIATAMKMPVSTVKTHLYRAVGALRERLGGIHDRRTSDK